VGTALFGCLVSVGGTDSAIRARLSRRQDKPAFEKRRALDHGFSQSTKTLIDEV